MAKLWTVEETTKKPHPFSKEWRALRADLQQPQTAEPEAKKTSNNEPDLSQVWEKLNKLEAENKELKDSLKHPSTKWHEINNDPKCVSFKMRGGKPVLSWMTKKKDPTKDLVFKNNFGTYESNHYLELNLLGNEETVEVEVNEFGIHHVKSDKLEVRDQNGELISNESLPLARTFTFDTEEFGTFTIALPYIN